MSHLFIYGTLRDRDVCEKVLGRPVDASALQPATAPDFAIFKVAKVSYPCLLPVKDAMAEGALLSGLSEAELQRLDLFEGVNYQRTACQVLTDGKAIETQYYKPKETLITDGSWSLSAWQKEGKDSFLSRDFNLGGVRVPSDD